MLKKLQIILNPIFWMVFAFYLGYGFSAVLLKSFIPDSWVTPGVFLSGLAFFFVLRWLKAPAAPKAGKPKIEDLPIAPSTTAPQGFVLWKTVSSYSHLFQAHAFSELVELLTQSRLHRKGQAEHIEGIVARAATKFNGCTGHKGCHSPHKKPF